MFKPNGIWKVKTAKEIQLSNPVQEFFDCRLPDVDPDFAPLKNFAIAGSDDGRAVGLASPLTITDAPKELPQQAIVALTDHSDVLEAKAKFLQTVDTFQKSRKAMGQNVITDFSDQYDWNHVISALQDAQDRYQHVKEDGRFGKFREMLRKCHQLSGSVNSWLRLLPSESWQGSLLCGGLKIIVQAAARLEEVREEISATIEQIPVSIESALTLSNLYPDKVSMHGTQLLVSTLQLMQQCLEYFMVPPWKKLARAAGKGASYERELDDKVKALKRVQDRIVLAASTASKEEQHDGLEMARHSSRETNQLLTRIEQEVVHKNVLLAAENKLLSDDLRKARSELLSKAWKQLSDDHKKKEIEQINKANRKEQHAMRKKLLEYDKDKLINSLGFNPEVCEDDLYQCHHMGTGLVVEAKNRAAYILRSPEMEDWITSEETALIVVNAHEATAKVTFSAASLFSATLLNSLLGPPEDDSSAPRVVLYWFCGQHVHESIDTMLEDLLGQLLCCGLQKVSSKRLMAERPVPQSAADMVELLLRLLRLQLRESEVYLVIDSTSQYEDHRRVYHLLDLWEGLGEIAESDSGGRYPLKVVVTSPTQCLHLGTRQDRAQPVVLWVPQRLDTRYMLPE